MADFCQMEEAPRSSVVAWEMEEKEVEDLFREGRAEEPGITMLSADLVVVVVLMEMEEAAAAVEGTLVEAVETMNTTLVGEEEDLITQEPISKMNAVLKLLVMVM